MESVPYNVVEKVLRIVFSNTEPYPPHRTMWAKRNPENTFSFYVYNDGEWHDVSGTITIPEISVFLSAFENDAGFLTVDDITGLQEALVSGENIKTINGQSIVGSGNLVINGGGTGLDSAYEEITISDPISKNSSGYYTLPSTIYETALTAWQTGRIPVLNVDLVSDTTMFSSPLVYINSNFVGYFHKSGANKTHFVCTIGSTSATINVDYEQDKLESGVNIKTINNQSLLGSGNITIQADSSAYGVTANNSGATFASLSALLSSGNLSTLIPTDVRKGGMQIRFLQTSDNKYVQYFLTKDEWSDNEDDWEKINLEDEVRQLSDVVNGAQSREETITPSFADGEFKNQQNYQIATVSSGNNSTIIIHSVTPGEKYHIKLAASYTSEYFGAYFVFAVSDTVAAITSSAIGDYVSEIDTTNHIYEFTVPAGTTKFFSACKTNWKSNVVIKRLTPATSGLVDKVDDLEDSIDNIEDNITTLQEDVQNFKDGNFTVGANQIDGGVTEIGIEDYELSFADGEYKNQQNTQISTVTQPTTSTIIIPAVAGDVVLLKLYSAIDVANYGSYFIFAVSDNVGAVSSTQLSNYVQVEDAENHVYRLTCPAGTTKIFSAVKTANKSTIWAKKVIFTKELKWLEVKEENINDIVISSIINNAKNSTLSVLEEDKKKYHTWDSILKPIVFSGKTLAAYGDSITDGVCSPNLGNAGDDKYISKFCAYVGATLTLRAISGSCIADDATYDAQYAICKRIKESNSDKNIIWIAGGTNDFNTGKPLGAYDSTDTATFYGALRDMCDWLSENRPNAVVIFVTPIPYTKPESAYPNHIAPLDAYRSAIYDIATEYGYNVVDGKSLGMPREQGNWNNFMCDDSDGCHPTVEGHKLYARNLCGKLL